MSEAQAQRWLELSVRVEREAVEPVSELLRKFGYAGAVVVEEPLKIGPDGDIIVLEDLPVTIRTYLPTEPDNSHEAVIQKLRENIYFLSRMLQIEDLNVAEKKTEDWANAWKDFYQVQRIGTRTVIKPPWQEYTPEPDDVVIEVDPGQAFGTGQHPTTRLCLIMLEEYLPEGTPKVLDLGTGSGVLAIAAKKLGAGEVWAVDTDSVAVNSARENIERNGLLNDINLMAGSIAVTPHDGSFYSFPEDAQRTPPELQAAIPFDMVIANIIARVLIMLAPAFAESIKPGGLLLASGIVTDRAEEVAAAFEEAGFTIKERRDRSDWTALVGVRQ